LNLIDKIINWNCINLLLNLNKEFCYYIEQNGKARWDEREAWRSHRNDEKGISSTYGR
jgi:hypothetical protein